MSNLFLKKDLPDLAADAAARAEKGSSGTGLKRSLGAFSLTMLGIGAIIGAGIFTLTGEAAASYAGPAIVYSFILGGILCALAGLCYAEMAAMIPVAGSAYAYSYATMGEFIAWIIGWDLVLEYAFGAVPWPTAGPATCSPCCTGPWGVGLPDLALRSPRGPGRRWSWFRGSRLPGALEPAGLPGGARGVRRAVPRHHPERPGQHGHRGHQGGHRGGVHPAGHRHDLRGQPARQPGRHRPGQPGPGPDPARWRPGRRWTATAGCGAGCSPARGWCSSPSSASTP